MFPPTGGTRRSTNISRVPCYPQNVVTKICIVYLQHNFAAQVLTANSNCVPLNEVQKNTKKIFSSAEYWQWRVRNSLLWPLCVLETSGTWNCKCKFKQKTSRKRLTLHLCINFFHREAMKMFTLQITHHITSCIHNSSHNGRQTP